MKRVILIGACVIIIAALIALLFIDFDEYYIENDISIIQPEFERWLEHGATNLNPIILKYFKIDDTNTYIALFQLENGDVGYAKFIEGWNGKLKVENANYGSNHLSYRPIETNKGHYALFFGKNPESKIDHIEKHYTQNDFSFVVKIPEADDVFLEFHKIPENVRNNDDWADYILYDKNNKPIDISEVF